MTNAYAYSQILTYLMVTLTKDVFAGKRYSPFHLKLSDTNIHTLLSVRTRTLPWLRLKGFLTLNYCIRFTRRYIRFVWLWQALGWLRIRLQLWLPRAWTQTRRSYSCLLNVTCETSRKFKCSFKHSIYKYLNTSLKLKR